MPTDTTEPQTVAPGLKAQLMKEMGKYMKDRSASFFGPGKDRSKRSWAITVVDGKATLPPSKKAGTRPGWRYHSRQARKALGWRRAMKMAHGMGGEV
jgi:hypothetical protein